jgi:hypothetical protein
MKPEFSLQISKKNIQIPNLMKIHPVEDKLFRVGRADRHDEANSHLCNFVAAPRKG